MRLTWLKVLYWMLMGALFGVLVGTVVFLCSCKEEVVPTTPIESIVLGEVTTTITALPEQ